MANDSMIARMAAMVVGLTVAIDPTTAPTTIDNDETIAGNATISLKAAPIVTVAADAVIYSSLCFPPPDAHRI
jgi:hypothetical protein